MRSIMKTIHPNPIGKITSSPKVPTVENFHEYVHFESYSNQLAKELLRSGYTLQKINLLNPSYTEPFNPNNYS